MCGMEGPEVCYTQDAGQGLSSLKGQLGLNSLHTPGKTQALSLNVHLERVIHGLGNREKRGHDLGVKQSLQSENKKMDRGRRGGGGGTKLGILSKLAPPLFNI